MMQALRDLKDTLFPRENGKIKILVAAGGGLLALASTGWVIKWIMIKVIQRQIDQKRDQYRQACEESIKGLAEKLNGVKLEDCKKITNLGFQQLLKLLKEGQLKTTDVLRAYQVMALQVHGTTNCLIQPIMEAEDLAKECDSQPKKGALAGIPISIKAEIGVKGYETTMGLAVLSGDPVEVDSVLVKALKMEGAIPFVRTNLPQLALSFEGGNPIHGDVGNPHDPTRGPGGSSSGESALIGGGGAILGFGSDMGGSVRVPAHFCGVCGFKPSEGRISKKDMPMYRFAKDPPVALTWGPLARDVDTIVHVMRALWDGGHMFRLDCDMPIMPFDHKVYEDKRPLKIGYFYDDGIFPCTPTCKRAVDMAKDQLIRNGHQVVHWRPPDLEKVMDLELSIVFADAGKMMKDFMAVERCDPSFAHVLKRMSRPYLLQKWYARAGGDRFNVIDRGFMGCGDIIGLAQKEKELMDYRRQVAAEWQAEGLDVVISPTFPMPALPLRSSELLFAAFTYTGMYNVLDYPAGSVRMTKMNADDQRDMAGYPDDHRYFRAVKEGLKGAEGMPVGVQVAALTWRDELCLRVMREIEEAADFTFV